MYGFKFGFQFVYPPLILWTFSLLRKFVANIRIYNIMIYIYIHSMITYIYIYTCIISINIDRYTINSSSVVFNVCV